MPKKKKENSLLNTADKYKSLIVLVSAIGVLIAGGYKTFATNDRVNLVEMRLDQKIENDRRADIREQIMMLEKYYNCKFTEQKQYCSREEITNPRDWGRYLQLWEDLKKLEVK